MTGRIMALYTHYYAATNLRNMSEIVPRQTKMERYQLGRMHREQILGDSLKRN